ncbi:hypothetical protein SMETP3_38330 [Serratia marcescens]|uniref:AIPR family protein n=2 Tax=Serratia TaxID=613 RepID=UPI00101FC96D|nr:AIPR family protein [Serratia marcescens]MBH2566658.1 AIPR family protein [Serratia marcescens]RZA50375.1 hypothetical protein EVY46_19370 [Serratia marcescens]BEN13345.1 hypothetical protein SMETP3_38330 [Serratia marcescens]
MTKNSNSQSIMEKIIRDEAEEAEKTYEDYFEIYSASQILKDYDVSYADIEYSIVGDGGDGGVDSIYTFLNGELIKEDTDYNVSGRNNKIDVVIIQSKTSKGFSETPILKLNEVARDLFDLSVDIDNIEDFKSRYNEDLLSKVNIFRNVYANLIKGFPDVTFYYYYASMGEEVHRNVQGKTRNLEKLIISMFTGAKFSFQFIGASELIELNRKIKKTSRNMTLSESPIATANGSYLCLVNLTNYYSFISDNDTLSRSIFESNVRDHNGDVVVNVGIQETLKKGKEDFWFLNNGITIITPKAVLSGKTLTIENPQVVNGLQTSHEIYKYFSEHSNINDERNLLVRVICEANEESRDRIIRATNSQTSIPPASLRSADIIHRDIEDFFKAHGYYYDRRKNFYKNEGKPSSKIISIAFLAQCVISILLQQPNNARARPSTLINDNARYETIFNKNLNMSLYLNCVLIVKTVERLMKEYEFDNRRDFNNIIYHCSLAVFLNCMNKNKIPHTYKGMTDYLSDFDISNITTEMFDSVFKGIWEVYCKLGRDDTTAKGNDFVLEIIKCYTPNK